MSDQLIVIRQAERPTVAFPGGATYQPIIGDDTGAGLPIRTGIQTSPPGYQTRLHSHPYVEVLTVLEGRGEAWLEGEEGVVCLEPGVSIALPAVMVTALPPTAGLTTSPSVTPATWSRRSCRRRSTI